MISWFLTVIYSTVWGLLKQMLNLLASFLFYVMEFCRRSDGISFYDSLNIKIHAATSFKWLQTSCGSMTYMLRRQMLRHEMLMLKLT